MSTDPILRQARIMRTGAVLAPVLAVVLIRFAGPQQSFAATGDVQLASPSLPSLELSQPAPEGVLGAAAQYARQLFESGISASPFPAQEVEAGSGDTPIVSGTSLVQQPAQFSREDPSLRVSAIMSRRAGPIAVIDSRIRSVGSKVAPGWTLDAIDEQSRTLVIRHASGRRVELTLSTP